jgi:hypothetical protein
MALTAKQRKALPASAFAYPSSRKYPVPTKAQAAKAGIGEAQRLALHRNALSRAGQSGTSGSYPAVAKKVRARAGGKVATVAKGKGTISGPGMRKRRK